MGNKISGVFNSKTDNMAVSTEFQYRYSAMKKLKVSYSALSKKISGVVIGMECTPQNLRDVGTGYSNVWACLKHSGASGGSSRRYSRAGEGEQARANRTKVDLEFVDESYHGFQTFCDAMNDLKARACAKYCNEIRVKVMKEVSVQLLATEHVLSQGKKTEGCRRRFTKAAQKVSRQESAALQKGRDLSGSKSYMKAIANRNSRENMYSKELEVFDQQYEEVMVASQEFCSSTTDIFLDCIVGYYREIVTVIDFADTPGSSRFRSHVPDMALHQASGAEFCEKAAGLKCDKKSSPSTEPLNLD
ncbi:hypothetical protein LPMP_231110 [Leishmania panamensis]|uniref:BAR domain-containing protein n=1 Tax=Leishmania panamensis TaxID=5679 RepID=A0A088SA91_LEIPA|nr:hypothetical protein LPMP_231110 [Leishmania panamensis]AIN98561.1 hypothetical protein LPMP_231110 [Leishmania panamensis]